MSGSINPVTPRRWVADGLAGGAFALALYRSGKVTGAIIAHMSANAVIAFWAIVLGSGVCFRVPDVQSEPITTFIRHPVRAATRSVAAQTRDLLRQVPHLPRAIPDQQCITS
jgi:phage tail protein X